MRRREDRPASLAAAPAAGPAAADPAPERALARQKAWATGRGLAIFTVTQLALG
jgi:hypothetical protein